MKFHPVWIAFSLVFLLFSGCAYAPIKPESLAGKNVAVIQSEDRAVRISTVDRQRTAGFFGFAREAELAPGEHTFSIPYYRGNVISSVYDFKLVAEAGHVYLIKDRIVNYGARNAASVRIVDTNSAKSVGEVLASRGEPVSEDTPLLSQSPLFSFSPPQKEDWIVIYRNNRGLALGREAGDEGQSDAIFIVVQDLPTLQTADELVDYVTKGLQRPDPEQGRFANPQNTVLPVKDHGGLCVRVHHVATDTRPHAKSPSDPLLALAHSIGTMFYTKPMLLENYGYYCQLPNNKNLGISYSFSRRSYDSHQDPSMPARAENYFSGLKF